MNNLASCNLYQLTFADVRLDLRVTLPRRILIVLRVTCGFSATT